MSTSSWAFAIAMGAKHQYHANTTSTVLTDLPHAVHQHVEHTPEHEQFTHDMGLCPHCGCILSKLCMSINAAQPLTWSLL